MQERILSRRIIYYTKSKLSWDCYSYSGEEEMLGSNPKPYRASYLGEKSFLWDEIVEDCTKCQLKFNWDKLTAISGLSDRLGRRTNRKCHAGIFEDEIGQFLLWRADGTYPMRRYPNFHSPSWSWAAYEGTVAYSLFIDKELEKGEI